MKPSRPSNPRPRARQGVVGTRAAWLPLALALVGGPATAARAHVESLSVVYEGAAGAYPVRVVIRPPGVVPGLADISIRIPTNGVSRVSVLPVHWETGLEGAPPPDVAQPVRGEPQLFTSALWLMTSGSYSVHVEVTGKYGTGRIVVPVSSKAMARLEMNRGFGILLGALLTLLFLLMISIVGAALRESIVPPGLSLSSRQRWAGRAGMLAATAVIALAILGGNRWWTLVDNAYQRRHQYQPIEVSSDVLQSGPRRLLDLRLRPPAQGRWESTPIVPDHGKLMHLYLTRFPEQDAFAHVHPVRLGERHFRAALPPLPPGRYRAYLGVTHESGFSQTLTTAFDLNTAGSAPPDDVAPDLLEPDPDDSWRAPDPETDSNTRTRALANGVTVTWEAPDTIQAGKDVDLRFAVRDAAGGLVRLRPYLGMFSHAALIRRDGERFLHLHPVGTISLAAQQVATLRSQGRGPGVITAEALEPFCKDPPPEQGQAPLVFPSLIPEPGQYRLWVQVRPGAGVETAVFNIDVVP